MSMNISRHRFPVYINGRRQAERHGEKEEGGKGKREMGRDESRDRERRRERSEVFKSKIKASKAIIGEDWRVWHSD